MSAWTCCSSWHAPRESLRANSLVFFRATLPTLAVHVLCPVFGYGALESPYDEEGQAARQDEQYAEHIMLGGIPHRTGGGLAVVGLRRSFLPSKGVEDGVVIHDEARTKLGTSFLEEFVLAFLPSNLDAYFFQSGVKRFWRRRPWWWFFPLSSEGKISVDIVYCCMQSFWRCPERILRTYLEFAKLGLFPPGAHHICACSTLQLVQPLLVVLQRSLRLKCLEPCIDSVFTDYTVCTCALYAAADGGRLESFLESCSNGCRVLLPLYIPLVWCRLRWTQKNQNHLNCYGPPCPR